MTKALAKPMDKLKAVVQSDGVKKQFENALKDNASLFTASLISLYSGDDYLQKCEPGLVVQEALKAAVLKLPIEKNLGYAYIVPFKNVPTFVIGYKGMVQLALRTGQFSVLNGDAVYEGEEVKTDRLSGRVEISGTPKGNAIGYFAHMELTSGYKKTVYWTREQIVEHAKRHSKSYNSKYSAWVTDFDSMAIKTVMRFLLSKYAPMSVEYINADQVEHEEDLKPEPIEINPQPERKKKKVEKQETIEQPPETEKPPYMTD
jgi:recombination protein RecT